MIKDPALRECQLIDGVANVYKDLLEPIEVHLHAQAKFAEIKEKERKEARLKARLAKLQLFEFDGYSVPNLVDMDDTGFEIFYTGVRETYHNKKKAEEEVERQRVERERHQQIENERLRQENERLERERQEATAREAEQRRLTEESELRERAARQEIDRIEAERKAEADRIAAEAERLRLAPEREKLQTWFKSIFDVVAKGPQVETPEAKALIETVVSGIAGVVNEAAIQAELIGGTGTAQ
jgi:uncharacterized membrane protein YqiK